MREAAARRLFYAAIIECLVARRSLGLGAFAQTFGSQGSRAILVFPATMSNAAAIEGGVFTAAGRGEDIMPPARQYARREPVEITSTLISSLAGRS